MTMIADCGVCSTLKELVLSSTSFDSDGSVRKLADILATAPVLKMCDISRKDKFKKIYVEVNYATED